MTRTVYGERESEPIAVFRREIQFTQIVSPYSLLPNIFFKRQAILASRAVNCVFIFARTDGNLFLFAHTIHSQTLRRKRCVPALIRSHTGSQNCSTKPVIGPFYHAPCVTLRLLRDESLSDSHSSAAAVTCCQVQQLLDRKAFGLSLCVYNKFSDCAAA